MITSQMSTSYKTGPVDWRQEASRTIMRHHIYAVLLQVTQSTTWLQFSLSSVWSREGRWNKVVVVAVGSGWVKN